MAAMGHVGPARAKVASMQCGAFCTIYSEVMVLSNVCVLLPLGVHRLLHRSKVSTEEGGEGEE